MNVFVLCTGRCGSKTFATACKHIDNYTAAHESRTDSIGEERLSYPDQHIEVDNRLSWFLGRLDRTFGEQAFYVHLIRNEHDTAQSYEKRFGTYIMKAYTDEILLGDRTDDYLPYDICLDYCRTVNANIESFLSDKPQKLTVRLEDIENGFMQFWEAIGAEGNVDSALGELQIMHNKSRDEKARASKLDKILNLIRKS